MSPNEELPKAQSGIDLEINKSPVEFSFWPTVEVNEIKELQFEIFCKEPWSVIEGEIGKRCSDLSQTDAYAFLAQARDFYRAAARSSEIANPLLFYYSFLNLVKALLITLGSDMLKKSIHHGLSKNNNTVSDDLEDAYLKVILSNKGLTSIFNELLIKQFDYSLNEMPEKISIAHLLPTVVAGHRIWKDTKGFEERFVPIYKNKFKHNKAKSIIWLNIYILKQDISRFNIVPQRLLNESGIASAFEEVKCKLNDKEFPNDKIICFEQRNKLKYSDDPLECIDSVIDDLCLREKLWQVATSIPPYRKYYLYLRPEGDAELAQLPALYALFFYFGSVTRYRPSEFDKMRSLGDYRAFISDFFASQPEQFLNLFASEFCQRKVVKPAIP